MTRGQWGGGLLIIWIARPARVDAAFDTWIWPLLGLIFLPFATLIYVILWQAGGLSGWDWFWVAIAALFDTGHWGASGPRRAHHLSAARLHRRPVRGADRSASGAGRPRTPPPPHRRERVGGRRPVGVDDDEEPPHDLRDTAASLAIAAGANVKAVQRMLGHSSAAMTLHRPLTCGNVWWGRSGLNRRPTDYEASQSRRSAAISARFVLSWWSLVDPRKGPFSNWCATQVPRDIGPLGALEWCAWPARCTRSVMSRPEGHGSSVTGNGWVTTRVCAVTSRVRSAMVTGCDAGTEARPTGSKRRPIEAVTAGAYGSQARAGPCRPQRRRRC